MLLKDYLIIDNLLANPKQAISLAKESKFFCKTPFNDTNLKSEKSGDIPKGNWYGCRTKPLHLINYDFFQNTFNNVFNSCFPESKFNYSIQSYFHLTNDNIKKQLSPDEWWHKDEQILAGVIFLNENPKPKSGIVFKLNNKDNVVENKFNRLVIYKGNILHRPQDSFGSNLDDTRLTLVFFVQELQLK